MMRDSGMLEELLLTNWEEKNKGSVPQSFVSRPCASPTASSVGRGMVAEWGKGLGSFCSMDREKWTPSWMTPVRTVVSQDLCLVPFDTANFLPGQDT